MVLAPPWSVTLGASATNVTVGTTVTLTAVASQDVGWTPYYIVILASDGTVVAVCGDGTTCTAPVTSSIPASETYHAVVAEWDGMSLQAAQAASDPLTETWTADTTAPTSTASSPALVNAAAVTVSYTASDTNGSGVASVELWWRYAAPGQSAGAWTYFTTTSVGAPFNVDLNQGDGTYDFYTIAVDAAGNREAAPTDADTSTLLDTGTPASSVGTLPAAVNTASLVVPYTASDANGTGIASVELWQRIEAAGSTSWTDWALATTVTSSPANVTLGSGDGRYEFYTIGIDAAGNREAAPAVADAFTVLDTEAPASAIGALPAVVATTNLSVSYTAGDDTNGTGVASVELWQRFQAAGSTSWTDWALAATGTSSPFSVNLTGDGTYEFYTIGIDAAGNREAAPMAADASTLLDTEAPASAVGTLPAAVASTTLWVPFIASDTAGTGSGIASVELWQRFQPAGGEMGVWAQVATGTTSPFSVTLTGAGRYEFYTISIDVAGNREAAPAVADAFTVLDSTAPVSSADALAGTVNTTSLSVAYTASDNAGSGVASVELWQRFQAAGSTSWTDWALAATGTTSPFTVTLTSDGRYEFYTIAVDQAGNREAAPAVADAFTVFASGAPVTRADPLAATTTASSVALSYTVGSGTPPTSVEIWRRFQAAGSTSWSAWAKVKTVTSSPASITLGSGDGSYEFYTIGISAAGVREAAPVTADTFTVRDTKVPTSRASALAFVNAPATTVSYTASDGTGTGVASVELWWRYTAPGQSAGPWTYLATTTSLATPFSVDLNLGDGAYGFYTIAVDVAGNREAAPSSADCSTVLDRIDPTSQASALSATKKTPAISISYSASDNSGGSGLGPTELWRRFQAAGTTSWTDWTLVTTKTASPFSVTLEQGDGRYEFYTIAVDKAGNREDAPATTDAWTVLDTATPTSLAGALPPITTATSITVPYTVTVSDPAGTAVSVQLWRRFQNPTTLVWSAWSNPTTVANGAPLTASLSSDGRYEFYTIAKDAAGNIETKPQVAETFTVRDRTKPATTVTALPAYSTQTVQTINFSASDGSGTGVVSLQLYGRFVPAGSSTWTPWSVIATPSPTETSVSVTLDQGDGRYEYYFVGTDAAGNVESGGTYDTYTILDRSAPTSKAKSLAAAVSSPTLSVAYTATEPSNASGVAWVDLYERFTPAGGTVGNWTYLLTTTASPFSVTLDQGDGRYEFYTIAIDEAGNRESKPTPTVEAFTVLDTVGETSQAGAIAPLTNGTSIPIPYAVTAPDPNGTTVTVELWSRFQAAGSTTWGSWAKSRSVTNGATLTASLAADGRYEFYTIAVDAAANRETKAQAAEAWTVRDRTAPVSSASALATPSTSTAQSLSFDATDTDGSGVASVKLQQRFQAAGSTSWSAWTTIATPSTSPVSVTLGSGDGRYEFRTIATDAAANTEAAPSTADAFVILDRTAPTSSVTAPPSTSSASSLAISYSSTDKTNSAGVTSVELWTRYRANDAAATGDWTLVTSSSEASGSFSVPFSSGLGIYDVATVAVDGLGNREATAVKASVRAVSWAASVQVNTDAGSAVQDNVAYATGPDGTLYAVWEDARNGDSDIYFSSRDPSTGAWSSEIKLNTDAGTSSQRAPSIAVDGSGNVYVVWADDRAGSTDTDIYFAKRTGSTWGANTKVSNATDVSVGDQPRIAVTSGGMAVAVWVDKRSGQANVYSARLAVGATAWSTNYKVTSDTSAEKAAPDVALSANGTAYAVWRDDQSNAGDIYFATLGPTATAWSSNSRIDDDSIATGVDRSPRIGLGSNGNVLVAWLDGRTTAGQVRVRQRTGTSWSSSVQVSDDAAAPGGGVALAVKADGGVIVAWDDTRATASAIWGAQCEAGAKAVARCAAPEAWSDQAGAAYRPTIVASATQVSLGWRDDTSGSGDIRVRLRSPS
ncbi:MAG: hypothetical protein ABSE70_10320 [Candidatus Limnocylindrales bacterium]